jgi:hypothetical protein
MLCCTDFDKVKIVITETKNLSNRTEAEAYEMVLLEEDIKKYGKQMLNVRHRKKEIKEIQVCDTKQISKEDFKQITDGKVIEVHITNLENRKTLKVRYTVDGNRQCKEIRYAKCGLEEGMRRAEAMKTEIETMMNE